MFQMKVHQFSNAKSSDLQKRFVLFRMCCCEGGGGGCLMVVLEIRCSAQIKQTIYGLTILSRLLSTAA